MCVFNILREQAPCNAMGGIVSDQHQGKDLRPKGAASRRRGWEHTGFRMAMKKSFIKASNLVQTAKLSVQQTHNQLVCLFETGFLCAAPAVLELIL